MCRSCYGRFFLLSQTILRFLGIRRINLCFDLRLIFMRYLKPILNKPLLPMTSRWTGFRRFVPCCLLRTCFGYFPGNGASHDVTKFLNATQGKQLVYFEDYAGLRRFCVDALEWADEDDSLMPELGDEENFVFLPIRKASCLLPISVLASGMNETRHIIPGLPNKKGPSCFMFPDFVPSTCCTMPCSMIYCPRSLFLLRMAGGCCTRTGIL